MRATLALLLPVLGAFAAPARAGQAGFDLARFVPNRAVAFVRVASIDELERAASHVARAAGEEAAGVDPAMLLGALGSMVDVSLVDRSAAVGIAVTLPDGPPEPRVTFLLPTHDPQAFQRSLLLPPEAAVLRIEGRYVVLSLDPAYAPSDSPSALARDLIPATVAVRVDARQLAQRFGPMLEMGLAQAESAADSLGEAERQALEAWIGGVRDSVSSIETLDFALSMRGTVADFEMAFAVADASPLARLVAGGRSGDLASLAACLDPGATASYLTNVDPGLVHRWLQPIATRALEGQPEAEAVLEALERSTEAAELFGPASAVQLELGEESTSLAVYGAPADGERFLMGVRRALDGSRESLPGVLLEGPVESRVGDVTLVQYRLGAQAGTEAAALLGALFEGGTAYVTLVETPERAAVVLGADDASLDRALRGLTASVSQLPRDLKRALAAVEGSSPSAICRWDLGRMTAATQALAARMAAAVGATPAPQRSVPSASIPVTSWGGVKGLRWHGGFTVDVASAAAWVRAMEG